MLTIDQRTAAHFAEAKQQRLQEDRDRETLQTLGLVTLDLDAAPVFRLQGRATAFYLVRRLGGDFPSVLGVAEIGGRWFKTVARPENVEWIRA